jgi:hypothetical protein
MTTRRLLPALVAGIGCMLAASLANAATTTITFDDPGFKANQDVPDGYGGMRWNLINGSHWTNRLSIATTSQYAGGVFESAPNGAVNTFSVDAGFQASTMPSFKLDSLYLTALSGAALTPAYNVLITGQTLSGLVDTITVALASTPTLIALNWDNLTSVVFTPVDGAGKAMTAAFLMDNITIETTPLPAALPLFAGGLVLMGVFGRRRKPRAA